MVIRLRDFGSRLRLVTRLQPPNLLLGVPLSGLQIQDPVTLYPKHLPGWYTRWGSRQLTRLQDFGSRLRLITRLQPPNLLPSVLSSGLQMQDPLPYTPSIYPAGASAGVHGSLPSSELLAPDSRLVTRLQDLTLNSSWLPGVLSSGLQMQDLLPYPPGTYPAGAPAGVHGGSHRSELLAPDSRLVTRLRPPIQPDGM